MNSAIERVGFQACPSHSLPRGNFAAPPLGDDIVKVVWQWQRHASTVFSLRLGDGDALALALQNVLPLELGHGGENGQHEFAGWGGGVDRLLLGDELDFLGRQLFDQLEQVAGIAGETADRLDDYGVALADVVQHALQFRTIGVLAACLVNKDFIYAQLVQQRLLPGGVLLLRADTDIADFHSYLPFCREKWYTIHARM